MVNSKKKCVLLLDKNEHLSKAAEDFAGNLYDLVFVIRSDRNDKRLPNELLEIVTKEDVSYLFNFLSPLKIPIEVLDKIAIYSINFHPASPQYPGVGCASFPIFNEDKEYGVSAHIIEEEYDSGPIIETLYFPILEGEYCDNLFARSLNFSLVLFYSVLLKISSGEEMLETTEKWHRKSMTRKAFEAWMVLNPEDGEEVNLRKIRATQHISFPGPFIEAYGKRFELPPRS
jgi:methionyl-tRNA formyltransferase